MGGGIMTPFENAIKEYLDARAKEDVKFAEKYSNEKKSIEECCRFILVEMRKKSKSGMYGATDAEVFGLAVHYYDEEDILVIDEEGKFKPDNPINERATRIAVRHYGIIPSDVIVGNAILCHTSMVE